MLAICRWEFNTDIARETTHAVADGRNHALETEMSKRIGHLRVHGEPGNAQAR